MNDTDTRTLQRIADALELQALISAYRTYERGIDEYTWVARELRDTEPHDTELHDTAMSIAEENESRGNHVSHRIDQLTGYTEEDE